MNESAWWAALRRFGMKPGLERTEALLERLGHPEEGLAVVHVGGTNGKGSTVAMVAAGLASMGLRVGRYTSPDLGDVRERVTVNGEWLAESDWHRLADRVEAAAAGLAEPPTRFEALTAMAFLAFREARVDVAVLEVGLGGRYDATNVVKAPWVTALTSIALDHQAVLGPTLTHIAADKCGIFKPRAPVVSAVQAPPARHQIVRHAAAVGVPVHWAHGRAVTVALDHTEVAVGDTVIDIGLLGAYQARNAAVAWTILTLVAERLGRPRDAARPGLRAARWPGRLEAWPGTPPYLLDGAHNLHGATALAAALEHPAFAGPWHLVFGTLADKPAVPMLRKLLPRVRTVVLTAPESGRAGRPEEWVGAVPPAWRPQIAGSVGAAMAMAERRALEDGGGVLVAGSFDLVGPVRQVLSRRPS